MPKHGVELVKFVHPFGDFVLRNAEFGRQRALLRMIVRQELVERRIKQPDGRRQVHPACERCR